MSQKNIFINRKHQRNAIEDAISKAEKHQKKRKIQEVSFKEPEKVTESSLHNNDNNTNQSIQIQTNTQSEIANDNHKKDHEQSDMKYSLKININKEKEQKVRELLRNKDNISNKEILLKTSKKERMKKNAFNFAEKGSIESSIQNIDKIEKEKAKKPLLYPDKNIQSIISPLIKYENIKPRYSKNTIKLTATDLIPDIEPWDIQYLPQGLKSFNPTQLNIDIQSLDSYIQTVKKYEKEIDGNVNKLIYHPIPIKSEFLEKINKTILPVFLTTKEKKRVRRLKKITKLKDTQEQIKFGLMNPKPPKLKYSNFIQLLKDETISDPSQMELKVRKAYEERYNKMMKENEAKKLSKEQRSDKLKRKFERDSKKECKGCLFRIEILKSKKNRFKIDKNSQQLYLTGTCLMTRNNSNFPSIVYVEGGSLAVKKIKNLLLRRIKWNDIENDPQAKCFLVWEGNIKKRSFDKWKMIEIKNESDAIKILSEKNMDHLWHLITSYSN